MVNVGDRGRLIDLGGGLYQNSPWKDGYDDFALLFDPPTDGSVGGKGFIWIYDGRSKEYYRDPVNNALPLQYEFPASWFDLSWVPGDAVMRETPGGMRAAGGKDLIGDPDWPDLAVGIPAYGDKNQGAVFILDMKNFDLRIDDSTIGSSNNLRIDNPKGAADTGAKFGVSVRLLGDFETLSPASELLVGASDSTVGLNTAAQRGRVYVYDLDPAGIQILADIPAIPFGGPCDVYDEWGFSISMVGNLLTKDMNGVDIYGKDGTPEIAISDPFWSPFHPAVPGCCCSTFFGIGGWFNSFNLHLSQFPTLIGPNLTLGGLQEEYFGYNLTHAGDQDIGAANPLSVGGSWDLHHFELSEGATRWITNELNEPAPPDRLGHSPGTDDDFMVSGNGVYAPLILRPSYHNTYGNQLCAVGDIDQDSGDNGHDDYAYVSVNSDDFDFPLPYRHEVHVADGGYSIDMTTVPDIYVITKDPVSNKFLIGAPVNNPDLTLLPRRTTVAPLGDIDGDGLDDFGVVSGYSTTSYQDPPTHAVVLLYGSNFFPASIPIPAGKPRILGNYVAQRGSKLMVRIDHAPPNAPVTLFEDDHLSPPTPSCGSSLQVQGQSILGTTDSAGEFYYVRDLDYQDPLNQLGKVWYYQAEVGGYPVPPYPDCRATSVWTVRIVDSSDPLDEYRDEG